MSSHQAIIAALAKVRGEKVDNCKDCKGTNVDPNFEAMRDEVDTVLTGKESDCPTCAPIRELDLRTHKIIGGEYQPTMNNVELYNLYCSCGDTTQYFRKVAHNHPSYSQELHDNLNPDLTTHMEGSKLWLVHVMQVLGEWDDFIASTFLDCEIFANIGYSSGSVDKLSNILTDGKLLVPAVEAWLKERKC